VDTIERGGGQGVKERVSLPITLLYNLEGKKIEELVLKIVLNPHRVSDEALTS
jgi:hypothetical protein